MGARVLINEIWYKTFIGLLRQTLISAICDVRSNPRSRINPQFNQRALETALREAGIKYVFLGKELGARSKDQNCYRDGQVQYDLLAQTQLFKQGIERVKKGSRTFRLALMCAEKEPLDCHRTILVARELAEQGLKVKHILADGNIEDHEHAIERLVQRLIPNLIDQNPCAHSRNPMDMMRQG